MRRDSMGSTAPALRLTSLALAALLAATAVSAQTPPQSAWRIGASAGGYVPFSALIKAADLDDTRLAAGPAFSLEPQYTAASHVSVFASGMLAFPTIRLGSSIRPAVVGPSNQVVLASATAGVLLSAGSGGIQPVLRLGGGFKSYSFDLTDADNQIRPTADLGIGLRGVNVGGIDGMVEIRFLPSAFDQGKLPTRGIATHNHRQNDFVFTIGIGLKGR